MDKDIYELVRNSLINGGQAPPLQGFCGHKKQCKLEKGKNKEKQVYFTEAL